jgi:hypothetical protein
MLLLAMPATAQVPAVQAPAAGVPAARPAPVAGPTPNAQRVATIAALDKRSGATQLFEGRPGEVFRFGPLSISLRTCEVTPPWEARLTGAFLQIDEALRGGRKRVFSGWMFAESPSLNPLEHRRYDVWVRSCAMRWPDRGPETVVVGGAASRSSAPKSAETQSAAASSDR